jgi:hypothetical protein
VELDLNDKSRVSGSENFEFGIAVVKGPRCKKLMLSLSSRYFTGFHHSTPKSDPIGGFFEFDWVETFKNARR